MPLWPWTLELAAVSIPLADVLADLTLHAGREDVADDPTASTLQITFADVDKTFVSNFDIAQTLRLTVRDVVAPGVPGTGPIVDRFRGKITDARMEDDDLTVIAAGLLSTFRNYPIGTANYPEESWSARVTRVFGEAGFGSILTLQADPDFNPTLAARDAATAGPTTLGDYLAFLAPMVGALVADLPNGNVLVQAIGARTLEDKVDLDPADVGFAPAWLEQLPYGNVVTVRYQADQGASVTLSEAPSIALYGQRPETIDTSFRDLAAAEQRARERLARSAYTHWEIPSAPIVRGLVLELGKPVVLSGLPASAPYDPWTPILEGWTDTITGDLWNMTLALSDPLLSGVALPWDEVPTTAAYRWNTVDPATDWTEALDLDALEVG